MRKAWRRFTFAVACFIVFGNPFKRKPPPVRVFTMAQFSQVFKAVYGRKLLQPKRPLTRREERSWLLWAVRRIAKRHRAAERYFYVRKGIGWQYVNAFEHIFNSPNPLLARIKKPNEFVGKVISEPLRLSR